MKTGKYIEKYDHQDRINDQARVLFFLHGAMAQGLIFNSHKAEEAFDAACRLVGRNPSVAKSVMAEFHASEDRK